MFSYATALSAGAISAIVLAATICVAAICCAFAIARKKKRGMKPPLPGERLSHGGLEALRRSLDANRAANEIAEREDSEGQSESLREEKSPVRRRKAWGEQKKRRKQEETARSAKRDELWQDAASQAEKDSLGEQGENSVAAALGGTVRGVRYVINDYSVRFEDRTFQADHILINAEGIFVIETKTWAGEISGGENSQFWTQRHGRGKYAREDRHPNPLEQNEAHLILVRKILGDRYDVNSVIVMANDNADGIDSDKVINKRDILRYSEGFGPIIYTPREMDDIYARLVEYKRQNEVSHEEHVREIEHVQRCLSMGVCPRCGGRLEKRRDKQGYEFWGCANYPRCKFKKKIK